MNIPKNLVNLPLCDGVVVDIFGYFLYHYGAEFVLYVGEQTAGIEGLVGRVGLVERLLRIAVVGEMDRDADGEFAFGSVAVGRDCTLRDVVADDFPFEFKIPTLPQHLKPCLTLENIAYSFGEAVTECGIDHRGVVREISDGDRVRGLVVDVGAVEFVAYTAARQDEQQQTAHYVC